MPLFGSSSKQTVNQYNTTSTTTNQQDQSGNAGGLNLAQVGGNVSLSTVDSTTLHTTDARSYSDNSVTNILDGGALNIAGNIARQSLDVAAGGLANAQAANAGALEFGRQAVNQLAAVNSNALDMYGATLSGALGFAGDRSRDVADIASDALARFSDFSSKATADAVAGFGALAKQGAESSDDRVSKVAMYALLAVAAIMVLPQLFKGGKAVMA